MTALVNFQAFSLVSEYPLKKKKKSILFCVPDYGPSINILGLQAPGSRLHSGEVRFNN